MCGIKGTSANMRSILIASACIAVCWAALALGGCHSGGGAHPPAGNDQPPVLTAVQASSTSVGSTAVFTVANTGGAGTSYSWDFGGGAAPNASTQASPSVTLGTAGRYDGSVTVTNANGTDTCTFHFDVADSGNPPLLPYPPAAGLPPQITAVLPKWCFTYGNPQAPVQFTFKATNSGGRVASWSWDFGGGATPNTSTCSAPTVTLNYAGLTNDGFGFLILNGTVTAENEQGVDSSEFQVSIEEPGEQDSVFVTALPDFPFSGLVFYLNEDDQISEEHTSFVVSQPGVVNLNVLFDPPDQDIIESISVLDNIYSDNLTSLYYNQTSGTNSDELTCTLLRAGTYYLDIGCSAGSATYQLTGVWNPGLEFAESENNDEWTQANSLPTLPFSGYLAHLGAGDPNGDDDGDNWDYYKLNVPEPGELFVLLEYNYEDADFLFGLCDSSTKALAFSETLGGRYLSLHYSLPAAGEYYLVCACASGYSTYSLEMDFIPSPVYIEEENNDSSSQALALPLAQSGELRAVGQLGAGNPGGDSDGDASDWFSFTLGPGDLTELSVTLDHGQDGDVNVRLLDSNLTQLDNGDFMSWACTIPGTYYIECSLEGAGYSWYSLSIILQ